MAYVTASIARAAAQVKTRQAEKPVKRTVLSLFPRSQSPHCEKPSHEQRVADVCAASRKTMTDLVNDNTEVSPNTASYNQPGKVSIASLKDLGFQYLSDLFLSIWHEVESLLFYAGIHPSYLVFRLSMAFQLLAGRLSPFLGVSPSQETKKGENDLTDSEGDEEGIVLRAQNRTMNVKRRRAEVAEHSFHGMSCQYHQDAISEIYHNEGSNYPGMVNLSGTLCYMNSILQASCQIMIKRLCADACRTNPSSCA
jgi:hypothetical protein